MAHYILIGMRYFVQSHYFCLLKEHFPKAGYTVFYSTQILRTNKFKLYEKIDPDHFAKP